MWGMDCLMPGQIVSVRGWDADAAQVSAGAAALRDAAARPVAELPLRRGVGGGRHRRRSRRDRPHLATFASAAAPAPFLTPVGSAFFATGPTGVRTGPPVHNSASHTSNSTSLRAVRHAYSVRKHDTSSNASCRSLMLQSHDHGLRTGSSAPATEHRINEGRPHVSLNCENADQVRTSFDTRP